MEELEDLKDCISIFVIVCAERESVCVRERYREIERDLPYCVVYIER